MTPVPADDRLITAAFRLFLAGVVALALALLLHALVPGGIRS